MPWQRAFDESRKCTYGFGEVLTLISVFSFVVVLLPPGGFTTVVLVSFFSDGGFTIVVLLSFLSQQAD